MKNGLNTHAGTQAQNQSQAAANIVVRQPKADMAESEAIDVSLQLPAQRKMQQAADDSPSVKKLSILQLMANNRPQEQTMPTPAPPGAGMVVPGIFQQQAAVPIQRRENRTGLPDTLKSGVEHLSGYSLDDVQVHYNSPAPAQLQAHAYAQGNTIHVSPGQERHLPHEAWHVVQQKQGRVKPTMQMKGNVPVNDDEGLEKEADVMGEKAFQLKSMSDISLQHATPGVNISAYSPNQPVQRALNVGAADIAAGGALPGAATGIIGAIGEVGTQTRITDVLTTWKGDATARVYADWATAIANAFFQSVGWNPANVIITNTTLTAGNCHGLTFGGGGATFIEFNTIQEVLDRWNGGPRILICISNRKVGHTATHAGGDWRQTLPYGPIFTSTRAVLDGRYTSCHDTAAPAELAALQALAATETAAIAAAAAAEAAAVALLIGPYIARLQAAIAVPEEERGEEGYYGYAPGWLAEAQAGDMTADQINNRNADLTDMGCPP